MAPVAALLGIVPRVLSTMVILMKISVIRGLRPKGNGTKSQEMCSYNAVPE